MANGSQNQMQLMDQRGINKTKIQDKYNDFFTLISNYFLGNNFHIFKL